MFESIKYCISILWYRNLIDLIKMYMIQYDIFFSVYTVNNEPRTGLTVAACVDHSSGFAAVSATIEHLRYCYTNSSTVSFLIVHVSRSSSRWGVRRSCCENTNYAWCTRATLACILAGICAVNTVPRKPCGDNPGSL